MAVAGCLTIADNFNNRNLRIPRYFVFQQVNCMRPAFPVIALLPIVRGTVRMTGNQALNAAVCDYI
jgi:hypothetical protein